MNRKALFAVAAPFAVLLCWILYHTFVVTHGASVELTIRGVDPRDLLSGHYLRYDIDYPRSFCGFDDVNRRVCVCFSDPTTVPATVGWSGDCVDKPRECGAYLAGYCRSNQDFDTGLERFYFPEGDVAKLATVPDGATIVVGLDG